MIKHKSQLVEKTKYETKRLEWWISSDKRLMGIKDYKEDMIEEWNEITKE